MLPSSILLCGQSYSFLNLEVSSLRSQLFNSTLTPHLCADPQLISNIRNSSLLIPNIRSLAETRTSTPTSSIGGTPHSHHSQAHSYQDTETGNGQGEIQMLARRILDFTDSEGVMTPSALASQIQAGSFSQRDKRVGGRDHEELRKSVREAFASGSSGH